MASTNASIKFYQDNHGYVNIRGDRSIIMELREHYAFYAPNYKFDKRYKLGIWDGRISLINMRDMRFYAGLLTDVKEFLDEQKIDYEDNTFDLGGENLTEDDVLKFYKSINGPFKPHASQISSFQRCIADVRNITLAPTSNGKSYIIHGLNSWYSQRKLKTLVIINREQLVLQLKSNFVDEYGADYTVSTIYEKDTSTDVVVSTWQSIVDHPESWFQQFDVLVADEVHTFKAKSLLKIMEKCSHIQYRHGFTATLSNDCKTDALTIEGLFGVPFQATTLVEQIEDGISARPIIYIVHIKYSSEERRALKKKIQEKKEDLLTKGKKVTEALPFNVESEFLENHEKRNALIKNIVLKQKGNTLVAFKKHEHGIRLHDMIKESTDERVFFANGTVKGTKRFEMQKIITALKSSIAVASFGTFSTGINIPNLHNLIIGAQVKSDITVPQLIGRMIRLSEGKTTTNVIDICDDLSDGGTDNIHLRHFKSRLKFYLKNKFEIKTKVVTF